MKKIFAVVSACTLLFTMTTPAWGAVRDISAQYTSMASVIEYIDSAQRFTYSTAAINNDNFATISVNGNALTIARRGQYLHREDRISILQQDAAMVEQKNSWAALPQAGTYSGYDTTIDLSALSLGAYTLSIQSVDYFVYPFLRLTIVKDEFGCSILHPETLAKQQNYSLLQQLNSGSAPNDFEELKKQYGTDENNIQILGQIEVATQSIIAGYSSDLEKAAAIHRWIASNIAYDVEVSGDNYYPWIQSHPEDTVRLDNPLHTFTQRYGLCYGFAKLTVLMMGYAGIDCVYITGRLASDTTDINTPVTDIERELNHAWNAVNIDGVWQFIDASQDVMYYYQRQNPELASTGYTETSRDAVYLNLFPSLDYLSDSHIAVRFGAYQYGVKLQPLALPNGWQTAEDGTQTLYDNGVLQKNIWVKQNGNLHCLDASGQMAKGWKCVDGYWRYFDDHGILLTGKQNIDEQIYTFDHEGRLIATNT